MKFFHLIASDDKEPWLPELHPAPSRYGTLLAEPTALQLVSSMNTNLETIASSLTITVAEHEATNKRGVTTLDD